LVRHTLTLGELTLLGVNVAQKLQLFEQALIFPYIDHHRRAVSFLGKDQGAASFLDPGEVPGTDSG
jgi:hypothetical protein